MPSRRRASPVPRSHLRKNVLVVSPPSITSTNKLVLTSVWESVYSGASGPILDSGSVFTCCIFPANGTSLWVENTAPSLRRSENGYFKHTSCTIFMQPCYSLCSNPSTCVCSFPEQFSPVTELINEWEEITLNSSTNTCELLNSIGKSLFRQHCFLWYFNFYVCLAMGSGLHNVCFGGLLDFP